MKKFFIQIFQDEKSNFSSKRFIGIVSGLTLCITMFANSFSPEDVKPADILVHSDSNGTAILENIRAEYSKLRNDKYDDITESNDKANNLKSIQSLKLHLDLLNSSDDTNDAHINPNVSSISVQNIENLHD